MRANPLTEPWSATSSSLQSAALKRHREFLGLLLALRARWPGETLYVVCDNFSPHRHPTVTAWASGNQVELVFLPTYGSWLNWIVRHDVA